MPAILLVAPSPKISNGGAKLYMITTNPIVPVQQKINSQTATRESICSFSDNDPPPPPPSPGVDGDSSAGKEMPILRCTESPVEDGESLFTLVGMFSCAPAVSLVLESLVELLVVSILLGEGGRGETKLSYQRTQI